MKRARTSAQKQQRRELILKSAYTVFQTTKYEHITLDEVASVAGLGKATLYSYFATREELFLALCQELLGAWFAQAHQQLGSLSSPTTAAQVATALTEILPDHVALMRLFPLLHSTIEHNVSSEALLSHKQWFGPQMVQLGARFEALLPFIQPGEGKYITRYMYMLILGATQMPNGGRFQDMGQAETPFGLPVGWLIEFRIAFSALLIGLESQKA